MLRAYLRNITRVPLLTREDEVALAKRKEEGHRQILVALLRSPLGTDRLLASCAKSLAELATFDRRSGDEEDAERSSKTIAGFMSGLNEHRRRMNRRGAAPVSLQRLARMPIDSEILLAAAADYRTAVAARVDGEEGILREIDRGEKIAERAHTALVRANLRLVVSIAKQYLNRGLPMSDLIQEGNLGLMRGIARFDHRKGCKVSTYVVWWIRMHISRAISNQARLIRLPAYVHESLGKVMRTARNFLQASGRQPTDEELAPLVGISPRRLRAIFCALGEPLSLDAPATREGKVTFADIIADTNASSAADLAMAAELAERLRPLVRRLPQREKEIIRLRFGIEGGTGRTLEEIGNAMGLTRERIRQIEASALDRLRRVAAAVTD
jgi:RNA polymerase primary sigma factor